ncbi:MAG: ABC transporter ATP-binding protein [Armatimonadota bacterium]|nr:ABC transporter ATP-binding protein [Armatimonadota bacterium]MDR7423021.1 ABC transporter ATP-binding protein [Armatimonadota bacterium]MDR7453137.1 ABC transporter ATP-binding protein [Armatimonadota bacterium]MDR7456123.1 ABC transporter ATP-binding protein [Armatimonadota bacterium]MDR7497769.1 ABC transporter ATP-binding protein [Armatimonadota bacterium]
MSDLRIEGLSVTIDHPQRPLAVLRDVSLEVPAGASVALVGESGAGKSMTAYAIIRLFPTDAARITSGHVWYGDVDLAALPEEALRAYRGARIAIIFQEPSAALNPVMTVGEQVMEGIEIHHGRKGARERALEALRLVGLDPSVFKRYPHHLSGGQRQRVLIASAIAPGPSLLIADEPTSGLDVTIQAQILDLISRLQRDLRMSLLLITHSLGLVAQRTAFTYVMRRGAIVEGAPTERLFRFPQHPYTQALLRMATRL